MHSADYGVARCLSVRPSHAGIVCKRLYIYSKFFSPSGSPTILVFPHQTGWQYSDGTPLTGASTARGYETSSSAVAKRPRDASYLSVVSFNSTKRRVESFMVSYVGPQIYHCVQLNALFCCLWRNVEASCHIYFVIFSHNQHRHLLPAMCHNLRDGGRCRPATLLTTPGMLQC